MAIVFLVAGVLVLLLIIVLARSYKMACPQCNERVSKKAFVCPHCGYRFQLRGNGS